MNKSKFLKRSLAAILAILMVVAMVPSAFAATTEPDIIKVQGVAVEFSGDSATVSITAPNGTANVIENALKNVTFELRSKNGTAVGILDKNGSQKTVDLSGWPDAPGTKQTINLLSYAVKPDGTYWGSYTGMKLRVTPKTGDPVSYPLTINVSERSASSNTDITGVESTRIVGARIEGRDITIIKPVGATSKQDELGLKKENFKLAGAGATIDFTYDTNNTEVISKVTVTAEDKSTKIYDVHYEIESIFDKFTLKDIEIVSYSEAEDGISSDEYAGTGKKTITVKVPFGAFDRGIIPTFTTSEQVIKVESIDVKNTTDSFAHGDGVLFERNVGTTSGVAVWAYGDNNAVSDGKITHKDGEQFKFNVQTDVSSLRADTGTYDKTGEVTVLFMPVKNTAAKLTGVNVGDKDGANTYSQGMVKIDATNSSVTVGEIPNKNLKDVDDKEAGADVVQLTRRDVELKVSTNAKVTILNPEGGLVTGDSSTISDYSDGTDTMDGTTAGSEGTKPGTLYAVSGKPGTQYPDSNGNDTGFGGMPKKKLGAKNTPIADHDGTVVFNDVNLRKYHSAPMRILVTSEDGANSAEYRINFDGTPEGKPEIKKVILHGADSGNVPYTAVESTQDKKGNIIIHVPYKAVGKTNPTLTELKAAYGTMTVEASSGATVVSWVGMKANKTDRDTHLGAITEGTSTSATYLQLYKGTDEANDSLPGLTEIYDDANFYAELHANYDPDIADTDAAEECGDPAADDFAESITPVFIYVDKPAETANITEITLTPEKELYLATNDSAQITGVIDHNKKTIRLDVPYSFNRDKNGNAIGDGTPLYLYEWEFNGADVNNISDVDAKGTISVVKYDYADLGAQTANAPSSSHTAHKAIVTLKESEITTLSKVGSFTPVARDADSGNVIRVWSEKDSDDSAKDSTGTQTYTVYAVRANASSESKLNSVGASAPVSAAPDTSVAKLNRFIITVPENYDSAEGINAAPEFELSFADRSVNSKVMNGQTTWVERDKNTAKFKVVNGKLYFKDKPANLTDGRVIHFTIVAEDGTSTGAYEFEIRTTEPNDDATVSSVKVDDKVSFTQNGANFVVEDLSGNELYDVTKLPVIVNTTDPAATVTIGGKEYKFEWGVGSNITVDLSSGKTVPMVVTAADGKTTASYTLSMGKPASESDKYTDLPKDAGMRGWAEKAINYGIMSSNASGKYEFQPKATTPRKYFALMVARADIMAANGAISTKEAADEKLMADYGTKEPDFKDIAKEDAKIKAAIAYCQEKKIMNGDEKGNFNPDETVNRMQVASMLKNWLKLTPGDETENTHNFKDWNKIDSWAKGNINAVVTDGIMKGSTDGTFGKGNLTREETAVVMVQAFERLKKADK